MKNIVNNDVVEVAQCPICEAVTTHMYYMQDADSKVRSKWYSCSCGIVFQAGKADFKYDEKYLNRYKDGGKKYESACRYPVQVYAPIIEESVYGRRMLQVGVTNPYQLAEFKRRGWLAYGIDKNEAVTESHRMFKGDFLTYEFPKDLKFNLIWLYHIFEEMSNPLNFLSKCFDLMPEDGIMFIATPDTDFINTRSTSGFQHWKAGHNQIMWNRRSLTSYLEKLGLNVIMCRRNYEARFPVLDDIHVIAQKRFF
jgi:hypothetical protein